MSEPLAPPQNFWAHKVRSTANPVLRKWKKSAIRFLIIGETGAGKTTFMSYVDNMCRGRKLEEFENTFDPTIESGGNKSESQTMTPKLYTIECAAGNHNVNRPRQIVQMLDTPGLGDTRGIEYDDESKRQVADVIQKELDTIDAVIIVHNGTQERLGITSKYALETISSIFPKSLLPNIGFMLTNCDYSSYNFDTTTLPKEYQEAPCWLLQNPLARWNKYRTPGKMVKEAVLKDLKKKLPRIYEEGRDVLDEFFEWLDKRPVQPTKAINDLFDQIQEINIEIGNLMERLKSSEEWHSLIKRMEDRIRTSEVNININKEFKKEHEYKCWERIKTDRHNTICLFPDCHGNCHPKCLLGFKQDQAFLGDNCAAFNCGESQLGIDAPCERCPHTARYHDHYHTLWELKIVKKPVINEEARRAWESAKTDKEKQQEALRLLKEELQAIEQTIRDARDQIGVLCQRYNEIAISKGFSSYLHVTIKSLEHRYEARKKAGASLEELERLDKTIKEMKEKYKIVSEVSPGPVDV